MVPGLGWDHLLTILTTCWAHLLGRPRTIKRPFFDHAFLGVRKLFFDHFPGFLEIAFCRARCPYKPYSSENQHSVFDTAPLPRWSFSSRLSLCPQQFCHFWLLPATVGSAILGSRICPVNYYLLCYSQFLLNIFFLAVFGRLNPSQARIRMFWGQKSSRFRTSAR